MTRTNKFSPPSGNCTPALRANAKKIWLSWNEALEKNTQRKGVPVPLRYNDPSRPVPVDSVFHAICGWIANSRDWEEQWASVLQRLEVRNHFLRGYRGFEPTLAWLFEDKGAGKLRPIEKLIEGQWDYTVVTYADEGTANDNEV